MSTPALPPPPKYTHWLKGTPGDGGLHGWLQKIPPVIEDVVSRSGTSVAGSVATFADLPDDPREGQSWIVRTTNPDIGPALYTWSDVTGDWSAPVPVQGTATAAAVAGVASDPAVVTALGPAVDARTRTGQRPVGQGELAINVRDYGAKGDTSLDIDGNYIAGTNDTTAIRNAMATAAAQGKELFFPHGIYYTTGTITRTGGSVTIRGDRATVYAASTTPLFDFRGNTLAAGATLTMRGITTIGPKRAQLLPNGIRVWAVGFSKVTIEDCEVRNADQFPFLIDGCQNVRFVGNRFLSCNRSTGDGDGLVRYIHIANTRYVHIEDNYFTSTVPYVSNTSFANVSVMLQADVTDAWIGNNHIHESGGLEAYTGCDNITISNNRIDYCHRYAIKADESSNVTITDNRIVNAYATTSRFLIGVTPYARMEGAGSTVTSRRNIFIERNIIENCPQPYLILVGGRQASGVAARLPGITQPDVLVFNVKVRDNILSNSPCLMPIGLPYLNDVEVSGNRVTNCDLTTQSGGAVSITGLGERADVVGNKVSLRNVSGVTHVGVQVAAAGGYVGGSAVIHLEKNILINTSGTPASTYGIDIAAVPKQRIKGNHIRNFNQHIFARSGADLLINDNDGWGGTLAGNVITTASYTKVVHDLV